MSCFEGRHPAEVWCSVALSGGAPPCRPHRRGDATLWGDLGPSGCPGILRLQISECPAIVGVFSKICKYASIVFSQQCPGCKSYVEREELDNLNVMCTICTGDKMQPFHFCWQCMRPWKGSAPRSDRCDNDGCVNRNLQLLQTCNTTSLPQVMGVNACPSIRACPTCGQIAEHDKTGCKNIICPRCQVEFCFVCLKLTDECLQTSTHFRLCSDGMAPRQTSIPVWHRYWAKILFR